MSFTRVVLCSASLIVVFFFLNTGISGRVEQDQPNNREMAIPCGPKTFAVSPILGVTPPVHYVCENDLVAWEGNGHKFTVTFKSNECPFSDGCNNISDSNTNHEKHGRHFDKLEVFKFSVKVDGRKSFDPYIVGGGGHGIDPGAMPQATK
jgi:hypothetical protein